MSSRFYNFNKNKNEFYTSNMKCSNKDFLAMCRMEQDKLKKSIAITLLEYYDKKDIVYSDGFIFVKGEIPILLTAHMDTVHTIAPIEYDERKGKLRSPQGIGGDDRCGIYIILKLVSMGYKPYILFCEDEETGSIGASKFCKTPYIELLKNMLYFIELDRKGSDDAVFYDCENDDFIKYILETTTYKKQDGSFSDICVLSEASDVASVNLSCGYYNPHTVDEYVVLDEMEGTLEIVEDLLLDYESVNQFDYSPKSIWGFTEDYGYYGGFNYYDTSDYEITYSNEGEERYEIINAISKSEAIGYFMQCNPEVCYNEVLSVMEY